MSNQKEVIRIRFVYVRIPRRLLNRSFVERTISKEDAEGIREFRKETETAINKLRHAQSVAEVLILRHNIRTY